MEALQQELLIATQNSGTRFCNSMKGCTEYNPEYIYSTAESPENGDAIVICITKVEKNSLYTSMVDNERCSSFIAKLKARNAQGNGAHELILGGDNSKQAAKEAANIAEIAAHNAIIAAEEAAYVKCDEEFAMDIALEESCKVLQARGSKFYAQKVKGINLSENGYCSCYLRLCYNHGGSGGSVTNCSFYFKNKKLVQGTFKLK